MRSQATWRPIPLSSSLHRHRENRNPAKDQRSRRGSSMDASLCSVSAHTGGVVSTSRQAPFTYARVHECAWRARTM